MTIRESKPNLCKCCAINSASFPLVLCLKKPWREAEIVHKCDDYITESDNEDFLSYLFKNYEKLKKTHMPGERIKWPI